MQLQVSTPDYTEERGGKVLYFWGDYPHWVVTNGVGDKVLHALVRGAAFEEIFNYYARETGLPSEDAQKDLYEFLNPLIRVGIIHVDRRPPVIPHVKDQFSMKDACHNVTSIVLNPTRACNYACKHCYTDADQPLPGELSCKEMISILGQVAPLMHMKILGFLGGEPLLRKEDVIKVAQYWIQEEKGLASVSTNGSLIDSHFAKKAADLNLAIQISVDGAHPETCDAVRGKGSWERAISGTKTAVENGALTWLCMVYQRDNLDELEDFISLGIQLGVKGVRFIPYNYLGRGTTSNLVKVMPHQMVKKVYTILRTHPEWGDFIDQSFFGNISVIVRSVPRYVYCGSGLSTLLVESNGDVYPCINLVHPEFKVGNLRETPFKTLWFHSPILKRIRSLCVEDNEKCHSCFVRYLCGMGCRSEIYELTHRITLPTFFCESWKKAIIEMCWILDEFPHLHERVTQQRQSWTSQSDSLINEGEAQNLLNQLFCR